MVKVTPLSDKVAAVPLDPPARSAGGIHLPTGDGARSVRFANKRFRVIAPERGRQNKKTGEWFRLTDLKPGDIVETGMYPGSSVPEVKIDGKILWFLHINNIIAKVVEGGDR